MKANMPLFIRIEEYKDVLDTMNLLKRKIEEAKSTIDKIQALQMDEAREIEEWKSNIDDVEQKVDFIDNTLFDPEGL